MQRIEEIAITHDAFRPVRLTPELVVGVADLTEEQVVIADGRRTIATRIKRHGEPDVRWWRLKSSPRGDDGDAVEALVELQHGDRVLSLEPDMDVEGYASIDLIEERGEHVISLCKLDGSTPNARSPIAVRRTIGPDARVRLRVAAQGGNGGRLFGIYLRVARASRSS